MRSVVLTAFLASVGAAQVPHQHHPPRDAGEYARILEDPSRDAWQKPHEVVMALKLSSSEEIADIGAGSGYFARRFARHAAKVLAVDIDDKLLAMIRKDAPANLATILATPDDPKLPPNSVDTIFICDVLHHIENRSAYYPKLARALKPRGRIVIVDFYKKELPVGPPITMKLSELQVEEELRAAGFHKTAQHDFLPHQYFLEFRRP
jgi:ubiquinone/menaquinone biosynthesis C-methylase UbiE